MAKSKPHSIFTSARVTDGRPSGGLTCIFKRDARFPTPMLYYYDKFFLAVRVGLTILIKSYVRMLIDLIAQLHFLRVLFSKKLIKLIFL